MKERSRTNVTRVVTLLLVLVVFASALSACSKPGTQSPDPTAKPTDAVETSKPAEEPNKEEDPFYIEGGEGVTLTYWLPMNDYQSQYFTTMAEHPFYEWLEEKTGVKVEFIHPTYEQKDQQLTLMISSGELF